MEEDATRWDQRYRDSNTPEPRAPEPLGTRPDLLAMLPRTGNAIDIACGTGAQSLWLAERGLRVTAIDVSPVAISSLTTTAQHLGLGNHIDAVVADLDDGLPPSPAGAEVIVCQRFRHPNLYPAIVEGLDIGGFGFVTVLSQVGAESPGPFHAPAGELMTAFGRADVELLHQHEDDGISTIVFRRR